MGKYINFNNDKEIDVIPIGRIAVDFNPVDINMPLEESQTFKRYLGGSPANIAIGLSRLSKNVGFISSISDNQFGKFVQNYFIKEGIDTSNIFIDKDSKSSLGLTFTEIKSPTESSIVMYRNNASDLRLNSKNINKEYISKAKAIVISGTALSCSPSREACLCALEYALSSDTRIIFDIDYRPYSWVDENEVSIYYSLVAKFSDVIIGSLDEFELTGRINCNSSDENKIADYWLNFNNKIVIIKIGSKGSRCYLKNGSIYNVNVFPIKLLKSFGGGDAYASSFIYGLLEDFAIEKALLQATASAAMLVSSHSCSEDMPTLQEIEKFIQDKIGNLKEPIVTRIK